jgi:phage terminase large subunit-like protein
MVEPNLEPFTLAHFTAWAAQLELDNGEPWLLEPFQAAFVEDVFAGNKVCWLVVPEGNGKTTLISGVALYHCEFTESAYVPVAASSRDQAEWIYRQAAGFVTRNEIEDTNMARSDRNIPPHRFRCLEGYRRIRHDATHSRIQIFAADDRGGDGIIPTLAILDELHRHRDLALYRTWLGKLRKRNAQLLVISTAGEVGSEFEDERTRMRQTGVDISGEGCFTRVARAGAVLHEWAVPEDGDVENLELVKAANPFSGVSLEYLAEKRDLPGMTTAHWSRFTCNLASRAENAAIQEREWWAAKVEEEIPAGEPIWLGLDVAWKWDTTAAVPLWWRDSEYRLLGPARVLVPPRDGSSLHPDAVEQTLTEIHARNPLHTVVMDTSRAEQLATWISDTFDATVIDRQQTNTLAVEDYDRFMEALREGWLRHTGDPELSRHVLNAVARVLPAGGARFDRSSGTRTGPQQQARVIDALTAAAMAHSLAASLEEPAETMFAFG